MNFLSTVGASTFINISAVALSFYLTASLIFSVRFSTTQGYSTPCLLYCLNTFSVFFVFMTAILFGFDLDDTNNLYLYNQHFQMLFLLLVCFVSLVSRDFFTSKNVTKFEYDILLMFVFISSICLCFANDFLIFYLAIELQSLTFYVFATFERTSEYSSESGLKYFVFGAIISCFLLLGFSVIYLTLGCSSFETIFSMVALQNDPFLYIGVLFFLIALLFKIGAAPFHSWLCDVYDGSVLSVTLLFATAPKIILFSIIVKFFFFAAGDLKTIVTPFLFSASLLSIALGSFSAIYQKRVKRLFAYSTIAHTGFILLAVLALSADSASSAIFYVVVYSMLTLLLFSVLVYSTSITKNFPKYLVNWISAGSKNSMLTITFTLVLFSIAGIPPLFGFFSKFFVLLSIIGETYYFTGLFVVIVSSIACFYYIRLIKMFYFTKSSKSNLWLSTSSGRYSEGVIGLFLFINTTFFVWPELLSSFSLVTSIILF